MCFIHKKIHIAENAFGLPQLCTKVKIYSSCYSKTELIRHKLLPVSFRIAVKFSIWTKQREKYETGKKNILGALIPWRGIEKVKSEVSINETGKK